jgi:D-threonate/D-erythronate kinase
MKISLIADDFTGSNDTGVQFAKKALSTVVTTNIKEIPKSLISNDVVVFDTESRFDTPEVAYTKVKDISTLLKDKVEYVYKKIDSTFRGNIGAEIAGAMDGLSLNYAILIPALPSNGRITKNGHVYVNGKLVNETEVANDPKTPVKKSYIPDIISAQTDKKVKVISKNGENYDYNQVLEQIIKSFNEGVQIIVLDAENNDELLNLSLLLPKIDRKFLIVGTAGLAEFIPQAFDFISKQAILSIVGSVSDVTRQQIEYARKNLSIDVIDLSLEQLMDAKQVSKIANKVIKSLAKGVDTLIYTAKTKAEVEAAAEYANKNNLNKFAVADQIAERLGAITQIVFNKGAKHLKGVYITGGDTLIKISNHLNASGMKILEEVLPAIPLGNFIHKKYNNIRIVTKAGGFGNEESLFKILKFLGDKK